MDRAKPRYSEELDHTAKVTLEHYNQRASEFWEATRDHDVTQNINAFLEQLEGNAPHAILDFGCGPGRDLKAFELLGHHPVGLDGSQPFVEMARSRTGAEVWHQNMFALDLPDERFDGVFANAVLFHIPTSILPRVLRELHATLKPRGVLFSSNPRGDNEEGWNQGRYGAYHDLSAWRAFMIDAGFVELSHYYRPAGVPREQQRWLASLWRKAAV
jgi:SAM-dependent methyltransferase